MKRLLEKFFPKTVVGDYCSGEPYLTRYFLLGGRTSRWALMVHCFHRSDIDRHLHDHPWSFITLLLSGYEEVTAQGGKHYGAGSILVRPAQFQHRVVIHTPVSWTIVLRFKKQQSWGFITEDGWVRYTDYDYTAGCE